MLKVNTTLTRLSVRQAEIPSSDVECIVHAMHQNNSIQVLDLSCIYFGEKVFAVIYEMLKINKTLRI
jgi:hypothetical protein